MASITDLSYDEIQYRLAHLDEYDNVDQLTFLYLELPYLTDDLPQEWFIARIRLVGKYSQLNLSTLAARFETRDAFIYDTAQLVFAYAIELLDQWSTHPFFDLTIYTVFIQNLYEMIVYYHRNYDQEEEAVEDLTDMMEEL